MKTAEQQEIDEIMKSTKADIVVMLINVRSRFMEDTAKLRSENAAFKSELAGQGRVLKLLELMAGESNLGLKASR